VLVGFAAVRDNRRLPCGSISIAAGRYDPLRDGGAALFQPWPSSQSDQPPTVGRLVARSRFGVSTKNEPRMSRLGTVLGLTGRS